MNFRTAVLLGVLAFAGAGCASYTTPGGPVRLADVNRADVAEIVARKPSPNFPARVALVRVQAPGYQSNSTGSLAVGNRFSVVLTQEALTEQDLNNLATMPGVAGIAPINRLLLPDTLGSLDDLRLPAAKLQADILMIYTVDTSFRVKGRSYSPLTKIFLGFAPDRDAQITSTASAIFTDVRTGFTYGIAEATAKGTGLTNFWSESSAVDKKRLETEQQAIALLVPQARKTLSDLATQYSK